MWESQGSKVTCGTEGDEGLRVLADHRQLVFGEGESAYDVLYEVVGDDRGHVPPQLPQDNQLPILKDTDTKVGVSPASAESSHSNGLNGALPRFH